MSCAAPAAQARDWPLTSAPRPTVTAAGQRARLRVVPGGQGRRHQAAATWGVVSPQAGSSTSGSRDAQSPPTAFLNDPYRRVTLTVPRVAPVSPTVNSTPVCPACAAAGMADERHAHPRQGRAGRTTSPPSRSTPAVTAAFAVRSPAAVRRDGIEGSTATALPAAGQVESGRGPTSARSSAAVAWVTRWRPAFLRTGSAGPGGAAPVPSAPSAGRTCATWPQQRPRWHRWPPTPLPAGP